MQYRVLQSTGFKKGPIPSEKLTTAKSLCLRLKLSNDEEYLDLVLINPLPISKNHRSQAKLKNTRHGVVNRGRKQVMINHMPRSMHMIVPPTFQTKVSINWTGYIPSASAAKNYFLVSGNACYLPFNSTLAAANSTINTVGIVAYTGELYNTVKPQGFTSVCAATALYSRYRVLSSTIKVRMSPLVLADTMYAVINTVTSGSNPNTQVWTAAAAPFSTRIASFSCNTTNPPLNLHQRTDTEYGVSQAAVKSESNFSGFYNSSVTNEWAWVVNWNTVTNSTTTSIMGITIDVEYDIQFFDPETGGLPDTLDRQIRAMEHQKGVDESQAKHTAAMKQYEQIKASLINSKV
jgi:hypothetical protein